MTAKLAFVVVPLGLLAMTSSARSEGGIEPPPEKTIAEHVDFAPGGTIRIKGSYGELNVESWDRPEVEVTVLKTIPYSRKPKTPEQSTATLDQVRIVIEHKSPPELTISTELPSRHSAWIPPFTHHTTDGVRAEYEIHVPRDSRLAIEHGTGSVSVNGVAGDIDVRAGRGDILLWLPPGSYTLDARTQFGIVSSDLDGTAHNKYLIGESFTRADQPPAHRLHLRMGFGGITLKKILPESQPPAAFPFSPR
ncbi:MAG: DUF4097 domain-containing protein [Acidobacteriota bacterium]|nr:DUF4097 domain-containing protein [Acidobacteriota bacterium]